MPYYTTGAMTMPVFWYNDIIYFMLLRAEPYWRSYVYPDPDIYIYWYPEPMLFLEPQCMTSFSRNQNAGPYISIIPLNGNMEMIKIEASKANEKKRAVDLHWNLVVPWRCTADRKRK